VTTKAAATKPAQIFGRAINDIVAVSVGDDLL
jgi:hypothetical protein